MCQGCQQLDSLRSRLTEESSDDNILFLLPLGTSVFLKYLLGIRCLQFWWRILNYFELLNESLKNKKITSEEYQDLKGKILEVKSAEATSCQCDERLQFLKNLLNVLPFETEYHQECDNLEVLNPGSSELITKLTGIKCFKCTIIEDTLKRMYADKRGFFGDLPNSDKNYFLKCKDYLYCLLDDWF
jgi:hypothetical protein